MPLLGDKIHRYTAKENYSAITFSPRSRQRVVTSDKHVLDSDALQFVLRRMLVLIKSVIKYLVMLTAQTLSYSL